MTATPTMAVHAALGKPIPRDPYLEGARCHKPNCARCAKVSTGPEVAIPRFVATLREHVGGHGVDALVSGEPRSLRDEWDWIARPDDMWGWGTCHRRGCDCDSHADNLLALRVLETLINHRLRRVLGV